MNIVTQYLKYTIFYKYYENLEKYYKLNQIKY